MRKRTVKHPKLAHPLDVALGARIREVREGQRPRVSQIWIAREIGCSVAQLGKYERGRDRVSFSRLCEICKALDITLADLTAPLFPSARPHLIGAAYPASMRNPVSAQ